MITEQHINALILLSGAHNKRIEYAGGYLTVGQTVIKIELWPLYQRGYINVQNSFPFITPSGLALLRSIGE